MELRKGLGLLAVLLTIHGCSTDMSEPEVIKKVNLYIEEEKYKEAVITLKDYIKSNPGSSEVRVLAGDVYLSYGDFWSAEKEYTRALDNGAPEAQLAPKIAQARFHKGDMDGLLKVSAASLDAEGKATVLGYQALALALRQDYTGADSRLQDALKYDADSDFVMATMAKVDVLKGRHDEAREQVEKLLQGNQQCQYCWSVLGDLEFSESRYDKAIENYSHAIEYGSFFSQDYFKRALSYIYLDDHSKAAADLSRLSNLFGANAETEFAYGLIAYRKKEYQDASDHFDKSLKLRSDYPLTLFYMALTQYELKNYERAELMAQKVVATNKNNESADSLMASILDKRGRFSEAANYMAPHYQNTQQSMIYYVNLLVRAGRSAEAIEVMNEIAAENPDSPEVMAKLGTLMLSTGDQAGVQKLQAALELDSDYYYADSTLALNHLLNKEYDEALVAAERIKTSYPDLSLPYAIAGRTYLAMDEADKAISEFRAGCELTPGDTDNCMSYAALLVQQGDVAGAQTAYEQVIQTHPDVPQGYLSLAALHANRGDFKRFEEVLGKGVKNTDDLAPRLVLARYYLAASRADQVFPLLQAARYGDSIGALDVLAKANLQTRNFQAAKHNLDKLISLGQNTAEVWYLTSVVEAGLQNARRSATALDKASQLDPEYYPVRIALARKAIYNRDIDGAKKHYQVMVNDHADKEDTLKVKAAIEELEGDSRAALGTYEQLFASNKSFSNMVQLSQQYWNLNDRNKALQLRKSWADEHQDSVPAQMALADVYSSLDDKNNAIRQYQRVIELDKNHFVALNNLAWLLKDSNPRQALAYSERAYKINPDSIHVLDTMALVLDKNGDYNRAKRTIERVVDRDPDNPTFKYHSALIDANAGHKESARKVLASLVDFDFPEKNAAKDLLKTVSQ